MPAPPTARAPFFARVPLIATVATDAALLAALIAWQWEERQPFSRVSWELPIVLTLVSLACGAVALIACRRANRVLLFLLDFSAVLVAAWLFNHLYARVAISRPFWLH